MRLDLREAVDVRPGAVHDEMQVGLVDAEHPLLDALAQGVDDQLEDAGRGEQFVVGRLGVERLERRDAVEQQRDLLRVVARELRGRSGPSR